MKEMVKALATTITDELKDAEMFYGYAKDAKERGLNELSMFFIERAKTRLKMLGEDHTKVKTLITKIQQEGKANYGEGKWDCLHQYLIEKKEKLDYHINSFK